MPLSPWIAGCSLAVAPLLGAAVPFFLPLEQAEKARVLYAEPEHNIVVARVVGSGRTVQFSVPADALADLKVGDEVDLDLPSQRVTAIKGVRRTASLREPDYGEPCCAVVAFANDGVALEALLRRLSGAEPVGATAPDPDHAEPVGDSLQALLGSISRGEPSTARLDFRSLLRSAEPVGFMDPVEPVNSIVLVRDLKTGTHHLVLMAGSPPAGAIASAMSEGVAVDSQRGFAAIRTRGAGGTESYTYPVFVPKKAAESGDKQWECVRNAELGGASSARMVFPYPEGTNAKLGVVVDPGGDDAVKRSYGGEPLDLLVGVYDVKINGARIPNVEVKAGHETVIYLGAVRFNTGSSTAAVIYDANHVRCYLHAGGRSVVGLPVGTYYGRVGTREVKFEVRRGQIVDF